MESLFQRIFDDFITLAILFGFVFFVIMKLRKESPKETTEWLKDLVKDKTQGEES